MSDDREITLTQGKVAIIDEDDCDRVTTRRWWAHFIYNRWYASSKELAENGKWINLGMHRLILNAPKGMEVDHIDGDGLNNRKSNLRLATHAENLRNTKLSIKNTSGYRGVRWDRVNKKWFVSIEFNGKNIWVGRFLDKEEAARAYDETVKQYFGEFARTNF